jgi:hypothetical protein
MAGEKASRRRTHENVRLVFLKRWKGSESDHEVAEEVGFGSADAMHQQLSAWGFAGLLPTPILHDLPTLLGDVRQELSLRPVLADYQARLAQAPEWD